MTIPKSYSRSTSPRSKGEPSSEDYSSYRWCLCCGEIVHVDQAERLHPSSGVLVHNVDEEEEICGPLLEIPEQVRSGP